MSTHPDVERFLERVEPARRDALRKILLGAAVYSTPLVASFSMDSLGGVAQAQAPYAAYTAVPAASGWGLAAMAGLVTTVGALLLRRRGP
jgi:hypothetical protein